MRVRTLKDVEKLELKIKDELGVNVADYKNEEVIENFVELLVFPKYVVTWVIRPILVSLIVYGLGFLLLNLVHVEYVIYAILGLVLFLIIGIIVGLLFLMRKMQTDIWGVVDYSLDIMKSAVEDISFAGSRITKENRREKLGLLFKGIIHIVTIPMLSKVVSEKVPLVSSLVDGILKKVLTLVSDKVDFSGDTDLDNELDDSNDSNFVELFPKLIEKVSSGIEKVVGVTFGVAKFPLKTVLVIVLLVLVLFLYLIN